MAPEEVSVVTERLPKSQVGMSIEVPAEVVDATYDRVLNRLASRAKIEGFRPGRAPRALVEARVGPAALREEVVETMVPEVVQQALVKESIDPIDNPDVEVLELERGRPAKLKATISVMPEVTLGDATKLDVDKHPHEVTDEMVERRLEDLREPMAEITAVEREVRVGDIAVIDIEVEADGRVVESETRKSTEAYRQAVREDLEESAKSLEKLEREQAVVKALVDASAVDVPDSLIDRELTSELESLERTLNRQGMKLDRYLQYLGKTVDQWMEDQRPDAEARLKVDLVLAEFARREGLDPSDEDVLEFLEQQADQDEELKGQVGELKQSPSARSYFRSRLRRRRVLDRLLEITHALD